MKYSKIRQVKDLSRGTSLSAGIDFYIPKFNEQFISDLKIKNPSLIIYESTDSLAFTPVDDIYLDKNTKKIILHPGERILIPSGIKVNLDEDAQIIKNILGKNSGIVLSGRNKSGVASKKGLDVLASEVDEDYQGEIHINLLNTSNTVVEISQDEKIVQFELQPVLYSNLTEVNIDNLYSITTERSDGGFGSTNK